MEQHQARTKEIIHELSFWPEGGFYLYRKDRATGLNLADQKTIGQNFAGLRPVYKVARFVHDTAFDPASPLYYKAPQGLKLWELVGLCGK